MRPIMSVFPVRKRWRWPIRWRLNLWGCRCGAEALIHLAQATLAGKLALAAPPDIEQSVKNLQTFPGIGRWTANYFALRGWQAKDIFLPDDYLIKQRFAGMTPAQIRRYAERWKPWRSYALLHIWYTHGWQPSMDSEIAGIQ